MLSRKRFRAIKSIYNLSGPAKFLFGKTILELIEAVDVLTEGLEKVEDGHWFSSKRTLEKVWGKDE